MVFPSFFRRRQAQGLSLNVIVIAVIAIAVLVIILIMLVGKTKIFGTATADCPSKGGSCEEENTNYPGEKRCPDGMSKMFGGKCPDERPLCCVTLEQEETPAGGSS